MARPRWKRLAITAIKAVVAIVVLWAVGRHVIRTWNLRNESDRCISNWPGCWSGVLYLAGLLLAGFTNGFCDPVRRRSACVPACEPTW